MVTALFITVPARTKIFILTGDQWAKRAAKRTGGGREANNPRKYGQRAGMEQKDCRLIGYG